LYDLFHLEALFFGTKFRKNQSILNCKTLLFFILADIAKLRMQQKTEKSKGGELIGIAE
jgi:hypothetical protein